MNLSFLGMLSMQTCSTCRYPPIKGGGNDDRLLSFYDRFTTGYDRLQVDQT